MKNKLRPLPVTCPGCGTAASNEVQFCTECGIHLGKRNQRYYPPPKVSNPTPVVGDAIIYGIFVTIFSVIGVLLT